VDRPHEALGLLYDCQSCAADVEQLGSPPSDVDGKAAVQVQRCRLGHAMKWVNFDRARRNGGGPADDD
jgi:hypothetical protein